MLKRTPDTSVGTAIVRKKDTQGIPPLKKRNGNGVAQSDLEKTEEFNSQYTDLLNKNEHTQVAFLDKSAPFMDDIVVSKDGVTKLLKGLNPSEALGPDELHPRVIKDLATELGLVFAHIFQLTLVKSQGTDHLRAITARFPDLCTLQVTRTHSIFKYHGSSSLILFSVR